MQDGKVTEIDVRSQRRIIDLIQVRNSSYGLVNVACIFYRKNNDEWTSAHTKFTILHKSNNAHSNLFRYEYLDVLIQSQNLTIEQFLKVLDNLITKAELSLPNLPSIKVEGAFGNYPYSFEYIQSKDSIFRLEWPANYFSFQVQHSGGSSGQPLISPKYPYFPSLHEAMKLVMNFGSGNYIMMYGYLTIFLPNYNAKINHMTISSDRIRIDIATKGAIAYSDIVGKLYAEKDGRTTQLDINFDSNFASATIGYLPYQTNVYLITRDGEQLDYRRFYRSSFKPFGDEDEDVSIEMSEYELVEVLRNGENDVVEFKLRVSDEQDKLIKSIVALANTKGGTVFMGVDDEGVTIGSFDKNVDQTILHLISSHCEPIIDVKFERKIIQGREIVLVQIPDGNNKPYNFRDQGIYVRRGKMNRIASRDELDGFYQSKSGSSRPFV